MQKLNKQTVALPRPLSDEIAGAKIHWESNGNTRRLWAKDASLWTASDEAQWLGWLDSVDRELGNAEVLQKFGDDVRTLEITDILLLGMGGSSLGPEVLAKSLGSAPGFPRLHVLDSTDPQQVQRFDRSVDPRRTLFIVSSKSGTTLEPNVLMSYFFARASAAIGSDAGHRFIAITDPGSQLQKTAEAKGFHRVFHGTPDIGGRYSVLSNFGLAPLAATGHDVGEFLECARVMARACGPDSELPENPGVTLGLIIGTLAKAGRDKVTFLASPSIEPFGAWAEQLLAESTGKNGKGVIPVAGEPPGQVSNYDADRLFIYLRDEERADRAQDAAADALARGGQPVVSIALPSAKFVAQEFFRFEIATAVAGAILGVNPFDQPDVEASKIASRAMTEAYEKSGALPSLQPVCTDKGVALYAEAGQAAALRELGAGATLASWLAAHLHQIRSEDYFSLLAYLDTDAPHSAALRSIRTAVRDAKRVATCLQFGPRYLHSTGQAYKGGPNSGVFLALTAQPVSDLSIPGRKATFGVIETAQARGDFHVLAERGRRILHAHIETDVGAGLAAIEQSIRSALS